MFIKDNTATILINSEVTPDMGEELSYFVQGLQHMDEVDTIVVNICSGGGSVIAGYAIYSALLNAREDGMKVITNCEGIAASIAGIIFLAGEIKRIRNYGLVMIHNPSGGDDKTLSKIKQSLQVILNGSFKGDLDKLMNDETWYDATELSEMGLVNEVIDTNFELSDKVDLTTKDKIKDHYELCNDILKNNIDEMKMKNFFVKKDEIKNADAPVEVAKPAEAENAEAPTEEKPAEEEVTDEEITVEALDARITALEEAITQLMEVNASVVAENNALKTTKENEVKTEILNKAGIEKTDVLMGLDLKTLTNIASTIKLSKPAPVIITKNAVEGLTQEVFNTMSKEDKDKLLKDDKNTYWKFFKNAK